MFGKKKSASTDDEEVRINMPFFFPESMYSKENLCLSNMYLLCFQLLRRD